MGTIKTLNLVLGNAQIPLKVKSNGYSSNKLSFNQLHKEDKGRVGYKKYCKECGEEVSKGDIIKGYKIGDDYIEIDKETIEQAKKKSKGDRLRVKGRIKADDLDVRLIDNFYYIDSKGEFEEEFETLKEAISLKGEALICSFVYRKREKLTAIKEVNGELVMFVLKNPNLIRKPDEVMDREDVDVSEEAVKTMVDVLDCFGEFNPEDYENEYNETLKEVIKKKSKGEVVEVKETKKETKSNDFLNDLKQSKEVMEKQKVEV